MNLIYRMDRHLGNYLRGQFLDAFSFGLLAAIALMILQVKYVVFLGAFAGLANLIPYVGPIAGGLLSAVVTILDTGDLAKIGYVVLAFALVKLADDAI
ncbi:MAG: AI-2E family transporter, partial [Bacteroidota bacterium]